MIRGVIGRQKFHYDVWGDAVNMASRMENPKAYPERSRSPKTPMNCSRMHAFAYPGAQCW
ncbi:adenylate/guanylate cyclase domain-containing protein [Candidatus Endoriftia persephone]|uniref:adenylate/guanylate cyclase domain-containing protein n=1 Tax=Candidatus Endoriftia persephonae TaxID=393765 RepID=UPI003B969A39